jgi:hypothetical protein
MPSHAEMVGVVPSEASPAPWLPVSPSPRAARTSRGTGGDGARASEDWRRRHHGCLAQEAELLAVGGWVAEAKAQPRTQVDAPDFRECQSTAIIRMRCPLSERRNPR